jgi:hypothetical protein
MMSQLRKSIIRNGFATPMRGKSLGNPWQTHNEAT